jgi:hypothetical protein
MNETTKHLLGLCGESHPNLFTITLLLILLSYTLYKTKQNDN